MSPQLKEKLGFLATFVALPLVYLACVPPGLEQPAHFPLRGKHVDNTCESCHGDTLGPLPTMCQDCHEEDRPVDHFQGDCKGCHDEASWEFAVENHSVPLTFAHDLLCADCHTDPAADPLDLDPACESCHSNDDPPNHYGPQCGDCHVATTWGDVTFDHWEYFPTPHEGVTACESCHTTGDNSRFECIECHEHSKNKMAGEHDDVGDYEWVSAKCLQCHPRGQAD